MPTISLRLAAALSLAGTSVLAPASIPAQQTAATPEYQLKAVFLFNFAQFVEWPDSAFLEAGAPLVIGILGDDPFGSFLDETVRGERINDHPLEVQRFLRVEDVGRCHILFVNPPRDLKLEDVLAKLAGRPILTVGDAESFAKRGGMIRFVTDRNRIRLLINLEAAQTAKLKLSSKLLRPAQIVSGKKD